MIVEWIRFFLTALFLLTALVCFTMAVIGANRFGYVLNRMHAAGIGDSLGLLCVLLAAAISDGLNMDSLKLLLLIFFMWFTSPVSSHFLSQIEYYTNPHLYRNTDRKSEDPSSHRPDGSAD